MPARRARLVTRRARLLMLLGLAAAALPGGAMAQVTMNPGALDLLPAPRAPVKPPPRPAARAAHPPASPSATSPSATSPSAASPSAAAPPALSSAAPPAAAKPATTQPANAAPGPAAAKPALPVVPPAIAALPPPAPVPPPRPQAPPVVPLSADAPGAATPLPGGVRLTFGPNRPELNPSTEAALRDVARTLKANDQTTVNIYAYAAGTPEDLSTARRLSLARALAARAVLVNEGVASTRIYPRALGAAGGDMGADRVDVVVGTPGPPAPVAPSVMPSPAPKPPAP